MRPETLSEISVLQTSCLFSACGTSNAALQQSRHVTRLEAIESIRDQYGRWAALLLQLKNRLHTSLHKTDYDRAVQWNSIAIELQGLCEPLVNGGLKAAGMDSDAVVRRNILNAVVCLLLEIEFDDVVPSIFYKDRIRPILINGCLPCGWDGPELDTRWAGAANEPVPGGVLLYY